MYEINFKTPIHVHFIGIGGVSMSGIAEILHSWGFEISGSNNSFWDGKVYKNFQAQYVPSNDPSFPIQCIAVLPCIGEETKRR